MVTIPNTLFRRYDNFSAGLLQQFPGEKHAIDRYTRKLRSVVNEFPLYDISTAQSYKIRPEVLGECATAFLESCLQTGYSALPDWVMIPGDSKKRDGKPL